MTYADKERLGEEIAALAVHLDAATHRLLALIARFDESGGWGDQGALTCAHWLCWRIGLDLGAAREHVRVARALRSLPRIDDALRRGEVSYSKVRALTRVATPDTEGDLLQMARCSTASQLERICRGYRRAVRYAQGSEVDDEADRWVRERDTDAGFVRIEIQLAPDQAATFRRALETAMVRADVPAETRRAGARRVDALIAVAEQYLLGDRAVADSGPPVEVVVHVEAAPESTDVGGTLDDGTVLSRVTAERLACDASVVTVREDSRGNVLDVGRRRRTIPIMLRRALRLRDGGCRFPGCTNRRVDGHHVRHWSRGGETKLDNLCSLCRRHHTFVHDAGIRIVLHDTGAFHFHREDGREIEVQERRPAFGRDAMETLRATTRAQGVPEDAVAPIPDGDWRRPDYGLAVWSLLRARPPACPEAS